MVARCTNPNRPDYPFYGGRGITVCDRWRHSFKNFLADMGAKPTGTSLDRINNALGYEPENCRWATKHEQMQNTRGTRLITFGGRTMGLNAWARHLGINHAALQGRLKRGWSLEQALTTPGRAQKARQYGLRDASEQNGLKYSTVRGRIARGWSLQSALSTGISK